MRYAHTTIHVRNLEKSIDFYKEAVGLEIVNRFPAGPGEIVFMANGEGETAIELIHIPGIPKVSAKALSIGFASEDIDKDLARAKERGWNPTKVREPGPGTRYFFIDDPDGVQVQFIGK